MQAFFYFCTHKYLSSPWEQSFFAVWAFCFYSAFQLSHPDWQNVWAEIQKFGLFWVCAYPLSPLLFCFFCLTFLKEKSNNLLGLDLRYFNTIKAIIRSFAVIRSDKSNC